MGTQDVTKSAEFRAAVKALVGVSVSDRAQYDAAVKVSHALSLGARNKDLATAWARESEGKARSCTPSHITHYRRAGQWLDALGAGSLSERDDKAFAFRSIGAVVHNPARTGLSVKEIDAFADSFRESGDWRANCVEFAASMGSAADETRESAKAAREAAKADSTGDANGEHVAYTESTVPALIQALGRVTLKVSSDEIAPAELVDLVRACESLITGASQSVARMGETTKTATVQAVAA